MFLSFLLFSKGQDKRKYNVGSLRAFLISEHTSAIRGLKTSQLLLVNLFFFEKNLGNWDLWMRIHFWCFLQPLFQVCFQATCLAVSSIAFILVDIVDMVETLQQGSEYPGFKHFSICCEITQYLTLFSMFFSLLFFVDSKLAGHYLIEIMFWVQRQLYEAFLKSELVLSSFDGSIILALNLCALIGLQLLQDHVRIFSKCNF